MKSIRVFLSENFQFLVVKFSIYLNRRVFVITVMPFEVTDTLSGKLGGLVEETFQDYFAFPSLLKTSCFAFPKRALL